MAQSNNKKIKRDFQKVAFEKDLDNSRVIDRDNNISLECVGLVHIFEEPGCYRFLLNWNGEKIRLTAERIISNTENPGPNERSDYHWQFYQVYIPKHLEDQRNEIISTIKEGFEEYGSGLGSRYDKTTTAEYLSL